MLKKTKPQTTNSEVSRTKETLDMVQFFVAGLKQSQKLGTERISLFTQGEQQCGFMVRGLRLKPGCVAQN